MSLTQSKLVLVGRAFLKLGGLPGSASDDCKCWHSSVRGRKSSGPLTLRDDS